MLIKLRRKSIVVLLIFALFVYLSVVLKRNIEVTHNETEKGTYVRDNKGFVQCYKVDHWCYKGSQISLGIVGEFASKSVVLCSDGHNIGVVSIPNLSTLLHVIEIPSSNLVDQTRHSDKEEQFLSLKTFIKSYGADNLFKLSDFLDSVPESSYLVVLAYTGIELPATELSHEVDRLFGSKIFSKLKPGNLYFGLFDKLSKILVYEQSTNILDRLHRTYCLENYTKTHPDLSILPKKQINEQPAPIQKKEQNLISGSSRKCEVLGSESNLEKTIECDINHVPVNLFSTSSGDNFPTYCVDGQLISYNGGHKKISRGLHLLVFNSNWKFIKYDVYDTYERKSDSEHLYKALMSVVPGSILMLATHDEASNKLSENVKGILFRLGSAAVARMKYRDSWVFIGQKGLKGKSLFEQLVPKKLTQSYAMSAAIQTCVPKVLPVKAWVDTLNDNLALFCEQQVMGYESVCAHNMTFPVESKSSLPPDSWESFFDTSPVLVIPDLAKYESHVSLFRTLESVARQPHLKPEMVYVALCKNDFILEFAEIVEIFGFNLMTFDYRKIQCFEVPYRDAFMRLFENKQYKQAIVVGAEVILEPDFLHYIFSVSPILYSLNTDVIAISGWNPNSFVGTNYPNNSLIRVSEFPFYGWVLTRELYETLTKTKDTFKSCCSNRQWYEGWTKPKEESYVVVPGLSRVSLGKVPDAYDLHTIKLMLYVNNRLNSSVIQNPFGLNFPLETVSSADAYRSYLSTLFSDCAAFSVMNNADMEKFQLKWKESVSPSKAKKVSQIGGKSVTNSPSVAEKEAKCVTLKVNKLKERSANQGLMKNLFTFLEFGHTEPFGNYKGAIVTYKETIPVLLFELESEIASSLNL
ncbi:uncharacterized protein LOC142348819 isoform X2 [Convolutriloba macropyga]|uniref:uncharacterized protein LOC142348819 isoform X2 n=1 Tax=Convolutriloba macropyga TaxID=536237 RepID=UPI003F5220E2